MIVTTKPEITTTSSPDKTTATTIPQTTIKTVPEDEKQTTKITAASNKPEANPTSKAPAKTTFEATKTETVSLNVNWESFSGDGKTGSYTVEVAKGTNITKSLVSGQVPSIYSTVDISKGNEYINTSAENSSYNFELFVY